MKVRADKAPSNAFTVNSHPQKPGISIVRFFENPKQFSETQGELTISGWEYDEYTLEVPRCKEDDILSGYEHFLTQAKLAEQTTEHRLEESIRLIQILTGEVE